MIVELSLVTGRPTADLLALDDEELATMVELVAELAAERNA